MITIQRMDIVRQPIKTLQITFKGLCVKANIFTGIVLGVNE